MFCVFILAWIEWDERFKNFLIAVAMQRLPGSFLAKIRTLDAGSRDNHWATRHPYFYEHEYKKPFLVAVSDFFFQLVVPVLEG